LQLIKGFPGQYLPIQFPQDRTKDYMVRRLSTAFMMRFTHFLYVTAKLTVEVGGKARGREVFRSLREFSTGFPHNAVDEKLHIL
jgi:hypothetical protein